MIKKKSKNQKKIKKKSKNKKWMKNKVSWIQTIQIVNIKTLKRKNQGNKKSLN